nr:hypothetical protein [Clavibacter sepedonicus]
MRDLAERVEAPPQDERDGVDVVGGEELARARAAEGAHGLDDDGRAEVAGRQPLAALDEEHVLRLVLHGGLERAHEEARLAAEGRVHVVHGGAVGVEAGPALKAQVGEVVEEGGRERRILRVARRDERLLEVGGVDAGGAPEERVLLGGEVVEERAPGDAGLLADLLDGEPGEAPLGREAAGQGREARRGLHPAALAEPRCTCRHEVHHCTPGH